MEEADFLLSPSDYEGSSISIIEAMMNGLPCIVSPVSKETVGFPGFVCEMGNVSGWAERILNLHNAEDYASAIDLTLQNAQKYSIENNQKKLGEIYSSLISNYCD